MTVQSINGMPLNLGDYCRFPNPQPNQPSYAYGIISALIGNNVNISYPYLVSGTPTLGLAIQVAGNTVIGMGAAGGPGNAESNRGV